MATEATTAATSSSSSSSSSAKDTFQHVIRSVMPLVKLWRCHPEAELEARFGTFRYPSTSTNASAYFDSSVTEAFQKSVLARLDEFDGWERVDDWLDFEDYFYTFSHPDLYNGVQQIVRTRVFADSSAGNQWTTEHMIKSGNVRENVIIRPYPSIDSVSTQQGFNNSVMFDIRISLKSEQILSNNEEMFKNVIVKPHLVRLQQRKTYLYDGWSFSVSRVWSAPVREAAEISQRVDKPVYEIECEYVKSRSNNKSGGGSGGASDAEDACVALGLLMKLDDFQKAVSKVYKVI